MRKLSVWNDEYRDIHFEIRNWHMAGIGECWTYYLYLKLDQMPENVREKLWLDAEPCGLPSTRLMYSYSSAPIISDMDWHCGITYYDKLGHDGNPRVVKVGCDYQHYWDEGKSYNEIILAEDAKRCIDSLHNLVPDILRWCNYCGVYFPPVEDEKRCKACERK